MQGPAADDYVTVNEETLGQQPQYDVIQFGERQTDDAGYLVIHWLNVSK